MGWTEGSFDQQRSYFMAQRYGDTPDNLPGDRGIATIMFSGGGFNPPFDKQQGFWWGRNQPVIPKFDIMVERIPRKWYREKARINIPAGAPINYTDEVTEETTPFGPDCNPAHIIYECLTDKVWGAGISELFLDDGYFRAAADVFYTEGMGLSIVWDTEEPIESFLQDVLDQIEAVLYFDIYEAKLRLRALRGGYDTALIPGFDETTAEIISAAYSLPAKYRMRLR